MGVLGQFLCILLIYALFEFDLGFLMTSAFFSELDSRNLILGIRFEPVLGGLILKIPKSNHITILK